MQFGRPFSDVPAQHRSTEDWLINFSPELDGPELTVAELFATVTSALASIPNGPERSAGMRKLLEARECFLRSVTR
jgi:hypothetical protein